MDARPSAANPSAATPSTPRPPVAILLGGPSAEHDVSIVSGTAIADALAGKDLAVTQVLIDLDGGWWWLPADHRRDGRPESAYDDPAALGAAGPFQVGAALDRLAATAPRPVVFVALHGPFGEDGTVQALLESAGLAYTGAGVAASAIGMDKSLQKRLWRGMGLPVVDWREVPVERWSRDRDGVLAELEAFAAGNGEPRLMVKPARLGSSVGMTLAHDPPERGPAIDLALRYDTLALVERYLPDARDLEVSVLGDAGGELAQYGPGEILSGHEFYDYAAKYTPGLSQTTPSAELDARTRATVLKLARDAYRAIGTEGFARIDFLLAGETLVLSEINTIPGFTPISLFPAMAAAGGYDFAGVCFRIIDLALARHERQARKRLSAADLPR
jgi:D-alanine-D-alanine ligase